MFACNYKKKSSKVFEEFHLKVHFKVHFKVVVFFLLKKQRKINISQTNSFKCETSRFKMVKQRKINISQTN